MSVHRSVRLGPGGRRRIVEAVEGGMSQKRAAARFCVSPATVNRWVVRARQAGPEERASGACFEERSCRPHSSPRMLSAADHDRVCAVRERTGWGPRLIACEVGLAHATVHRALRRRGCSRRPRRTCCGRGPEDGRHPLALQRCHDRVVDLERGDAGQLVGEAVGGGCRSGRRG
jgi:transposase